MAIRVGIQNSVKFSSVSLDDNKNVNMVFTQGEEVDTMSALMGDGNLGGAESSKVIIWPLKGTGYQEAKLEGKQVVEHINQYKAFFNEILTHFFKKEDISWKSMFEGVSVTVAQDIENLSASDIEKVGKNINSIFVEHMSKADSKAEFRIKFYRSSAAKNFVTLTPDMFMKFGKTVDVNGFRKSWTVPFMESMSIPAEQSKLSYSTYEVEKGKNNDKAVVADVNPAAGDNDLPF